MRAPLIQALRTGIRSEAAGLNGTVRPLPDRVIAPHLLRAVASSTPLLSCTDPHRITPHDGCPPAGSDDVAVVGTVLPAHGHDVAVTDRRVDHAVTGDGKPTSSPNLGGLCLGTGGDPASTALSLTWVRSLRLWGRRALGHLPYGRPSRRDGATTSSNGPGMTTRSGRVPAWPGLCRSQRKPLLH